MEETIYTKDEIELFALIKWSNDFMSNFPFTNDEDRKTAADYIKAYKNTEDVVIKCANSRADDIKRIEEENNGKMHSYHDVTCTNCNFFTALKPVGKKKNKGGYTCPTFECPKCHVIFASNNPVSVEETIKISRAVIVLMKKDKVPSERIQAFQDATDNLLRAENNLLEEQAGYYKLHADLAALVTKNIQDLTKYKLRVLAGHQPTEIN